MHSSSRKGSPSRKGSSSRTPSPKKPSPSRKSSPSRKFSNALLYDSAENGDIDTVKEQIKLGANIDWAISKNFYNTPLIVSARNGHADIVETLILAGADKNQGNYARETPIFVASTYGKLSVVEMLIKYEVDVTKKNNMGYTPLHQAVFFDESQMNHLKIIEIIKLLINHGANINAQNKNGNTPLHGAAIQGKKDMVLILLLNGADIKIKNQYNKLASEMARENNFPEIAEMIEKWPTLYALAALDDNYSLNSIDTQDIEYMYRVMGGKRKTRGKRILGRKTKSNHRRRD
jgi:ankyrin repeat protein